MEWKLYLDFFLSVAKSMSKYCYIIMRKHFKSMSKYCYIIMRKHFLIRYWLLQLRYNICICNTHVYNIYESQDHFYIHLPLTIQVICIFSSSELLRLFFHVIHRWVSTQNIRRKTILIAWCLQLTIQSMNSQNNFVLWYIFPGILPQHPMKNIEKEAINMVILAAAPMLSKRHWLLTF